MCTYKIAEIFSSINGEGRKAGQTAAFVRFTGCNLNCSYCDTKWANEPDAKYTQMTADGILSEVQKSGAVNVTVTGGEPLIQPDVKDLIVLLGEKGFEVEIETNGSVDISEYAALSPRPAFTLDYKLISSGMEGSMLTENYALLDPERDAVKFVSGSREDLERAAEVIKKYRLTEKCAVFISPVFGGIDPSEIVAFMLEKKLNGVRLQLQLHKLIWDPDARGV